MTTIISGNTPSTIGDDTTISGDITANNLPANGSIVGYQEGVWTPITSFSVTPGSPTYTSSGHWSRVGNKIDILGAFNISGVGGGSGAIQQTGLPYPIADVISISSLEGYGSVSYLANSTGVTVMPGAVASAADQRVFFYLIGSSNLTQAHVQTNFSVRYSLTYFTDDTTWTPQNGATVS